MLSKKFALGFGIAILFPMLVFYGVSTFSTPPAWDDFHLQDFFAKHDRASDEEKIKLEQERNRLEAEFKAKEAVFNKHLFLISAPVGLVAIIAGTVISIQAVGSGLMFGGILTLLVGYCSYWGELSDVIRFVSLLVAVAVLIFIGYRKLDLKKS